MTAGWVNRAAYWEGGYTRTQYDALGRVTRTTAPNGEVTNTTYAGRQTKVMGVGRNTYSNKTLQWTETDGLGNLKIVRTGDGAGSELTRVTLAYDVLGNLTGVTHPGGAVTTLSYDLGGRKRVMVDPDLGTWRYDYNRQGQLVSQTDGCGNGLALSYDGLGRLVQEVATPGAGCLSSAVTTAATTTWYSYDGNHSATNRSRGQLTGVSYGDGSYSKQRFFNARGQLANETVAIGGAPQPYYTRLYGYDAYDRLQTASWPDGDMMNVTGYDSQGRPLGLTSTPAGGPQLVVDSVLYDAAGRLVQLREAGSGSGGGVWVSHVYRPWLGGDGNSNGRPWGMNVGSAAGGNNLFTTWYSHDTYGNPVAYATTEGGVQKDSTAFSYDGQNRVTGGYGEGFVWQHRGVRSSIDGVTLGYDSVHTHAVELVGGVDRYDYNLNGGTTVRNKGLSNQQTLKWDSHARLAQVVGAGVNESYLYDETGQRLRKTNNLTGVSTFYPFAGYEQTGGAVTKHYSFGGRFVAVRSPNGSLSFLFQDQVSSTVYVTNADGSKQAARGYYDFGVTRYTEGVMPSEYHFTGQREDGTGLYYYGARYYDPDLGNFISPDTVVPDPTRLIDYNRYLYARGNPVKYNDPSGHVAVCFEGGPAPDLWKPESSEDETQVSSLNGAAACRDTYNHLSQQEQQTLGMLYFLRNNSYGIGLAERYIRDAKLASPDEPVVVMGYSWGGPASFTLARNLDRVDANRDQGPINVDLMLLIDPEFILRDGNAPPLQEPSLPDNVSKGIQFKAYYSTAGLFPPFSIFQDGTPSIAGATTVDLAAYVDARPYGEAIVMDHQTIVNTKQGQALIRRHLVSALHTFLEAR